MSWYDFAAGCLAGSAGIFVGHPSDTLKVKLQTGSNHSLLSSVKHTYQHHNIQGFFRGMTFPLVTSGFINSILFGVYGHVCSFMGETDYANINKDRLPSLSTVYLAGCAGGLAQVGFVIPIELVKVKLQAVTFFFPGVVLGSLGFGNNYRGSIDCLRHLICTSGFRGCYQGGLITVIRDVPSYATYMLTYEWTLYKLCKRKKQDVMNTLLAGGCAGIVSWFMIIPLDVVKSRLQAEDFRSPKYKGIIHCFKESYLEGGLRIFFKGSGLMVLRAFPVNATILFVYSTSLSFFNSSN